MITCWKVRKIVTDRTYASNWKQMKRVQAKNFCHCCQFISINEKKNFRKNCDESNKVKKNFRKNCKKISGRIATKVTFKIGLLHDLFPFHKFTILNIKEGFTFVK